MQSDRHERISERAYQMWVAEGRGHGRHDEHWHRAERAIAEEEKRLTATPADRASSGDAAETSVAAPRRRKRASSVGAAAGMAATRRSAGAAMALGSGSSRAGSAGTDGG